MGVKILTSSMYLHSYIMQERMMTSFLLRREEEERVTSYSGRGESRKQNLPRVL